MRHAEDLWPLLQVMWGPDDCRTGSQPLTCTPLLRSVGVRGVRMKDVVVHVCNNLRRYRPALSSHITQEVMDGVDAYVAAAALTARREVQRHHA